MYLGFCHILKFYFITLCSVLSYVVVPRATDEGALAHDTIRYNCHKKSHSVTCHPTPALTPARQAGTRFTYPGGMEG